LQSKTTKISGPRLCLAGLWVVLATGLFDLFPLKSSEALANDERFSNFEIRVIRPRYFSKRKKVELGTQAVAITNQTFIYTYLLSGILTYHFTEQIGLQLSVTYGVSTNKDDKNILENDFNIKTQIIRTKSMFSGYLLWTPMYGKYQMASGRLIYFDTYLSGGMGTTGVSYQFDHCVADDGTKTGVREDYIQQYPTLSGGIGQRFFISRKSSINWDLKIHGLQVDAKDGACTESDDIESTKTLFNNLTMQFGYSRFF